MKIGVFFYSNFSYLKHHSFTTKTLWGLLKNKNKKTIIKEEEDDEQFTLCLEHQNLLKEMKKL